MDHYISARAQYFDESINTIKYLENKSKISYDDIAKKMFADEKNLLKLLYKDEIIISRISDEKFDEYFNKGDYASVNNRGFVLQFSLVDLNREEADSIINRMIRVEFEQDEVYKLAKFYNNVYLPAKLRRAEKGGKNV